MTLLVGMIGSDGIVLSADQSRVRPADAEGNFDDQMLGPKIYHIGRHGIAYAVAGDDLTDEIGYRLEQYISEGSLESSENRAPHLQDLVKRAIADIQAKRGAPHKDELVVERTILLVFYAAQPELWRIRITPSLSAKPVSGITVAGAFGNSARFFEYYFQPNLPVQRLLPLAAHIVLMGGRIDTEMVKGLDVAIIQRGAHKFLDENEKAVLRERSENLDTSIREHLLRQR